MRAGILKDLRKKRLYVKPSTARRLESVAARRRRLKARARARRGNPAPVVVARRAASWPQRVDPTD